MFKLVVLGLKGLGALDGPKKWLELVGWVKHFILRSP